MLVAVQVTDEGRPVLLKLSVVGRFRKVEHKPRVTGGGKSGCETPGLTWVNTILGNVKRSLNGTYHAFGPRYAPRYAPRYLAEFQYRFNRRYELAALPQRLLTAAATALPLPRPMLMSVA